MFWAVIKACLVGWYFMHLKFEGKWVYYMLVPAGILAIVLIFALIPDIAMQPVTEENPEEEVSTPISAAELGRRAADHPAESRDPIPRIDPQSRRRMADSANVSICDHRRHLRI